MNKHDFHLRYRLHSLSSSITSIPLPYKSRQAAVLVPVIEVNQELHLLLTKRSLHLRHHPGQISFPGGKVEKTDSNAIFTALREAYEEIGLAHDNVDILGVFPSHHTLTGFEITPVVGMIKQPFQLILDPGEVADCFTVPLSFFINKGNRHNTLYYRNGIFYDVHFMPFEDRFIWGVTAAIIDLLCRHID